MRNDMKRISQRDIAKILGVNVSTVSRALRGLDGVSPELRQQIERLAASEGYRPNPFAGKRQTLGAIVRWILVQTFYQFIL